MSNSTIGMQGYLYTGQFDPLNPTSYLIAKDDDGNNRSDQFSLALRLRSGTKYILITTAAQHDQEAMFTLHVSGPANITFLKRLGESSCFLTDRVREEVVNERACHVTVTVTSPVRRSQNDCLNSGTCLLRRASRRSCRQFHPQS